MALDVADGFAQGLRALGDCGMARTCAPRLDRFGIQPHGEQERAHLVVQVAGQFGALFFLDRQHLCRSGGGWRLPEPPAAPSCG